EPRMRLFNYSCPGCGYRFRWIERFRAAGCFGFARRVSKCPVCGVSVVWSSWPWRVMIGGSIIAVGLLPVGILMVWDTSPSAGAVCWLVFLFLACAAVVWGCFSLRFELLGTVNKQP